MRKGLYLNGGLSYADMSVADKRIVAQQDILILYPGTRFEEMNQMRNLAIGGDNRMQRRLVLLNDWLTVTPPGKGVHKARVADDEEWCCSYAIALKAQENGWITDHPIRPGGPDASGYQMLAAVDQLGYVNCFVETVEEFAKKWFRNGITGIHTEWGYRLEPYDSYRDVFDLDIYRAHTRLMLSELRRIANYWALSLTCQHPPVTAIPENLHLRKIDGAKWELWPGQLTEKFNDAQERGAGWWAENRGAMDHCWMEIVREPEWDDATWSAKLCVAVAAAKRIGAALCWYPRGWDKGYHAVIPQKWWPVGG